MSRRASSVAQTRRRIVDAARELHAEQGIAATSWDDIAARAGVGVGTVYRHFPSADELIPACGQAVMGIVALPDPAGAPARFDGLRTPEERIGRLVGEAFAIYERGAPELRAVKREPDVHPAVSATAAALEASLSALVACALEPLGARAQDHAVARAMVDLNTWEALRAAGLDAEAAVVAVGEMLTARMTGRGCG